MKPMRNRSHLPALLGAGLFAAMLFVATQPIAPEPNINKPKRLNDYVPGQVLVQYRSFMNDSSAQSHVQSMNHSFVKSIRHHYANKGPLHLVSTNGMPVEDAVQAYRTDPRVERVQPNFIYRISAAPNDPSYGQLWGMRNIAQPVTGATYTTHNPGSSGSDIDAELAWNVQTDCSNTTVAVIDTGVNYNHEDLSSNMATGSYTCPSGTGTHGCDFVGAGDADPMDHNGHGTHVAGTIGAIGNNNKGVAGVCWTAKILAVRVLDVGGSGATSEIVEGLNFAIGTGAGEGNAKVVNMSLGGSSSDADFITALDNAKANGVVVVVAAGNSNQNHGTTAGYPCDYTQDNIICVAAADQSYARASFSDYGTTSVDIAAPGTNVRSTYFGTSTLVNASENFLTGWTRTPASGGWAQGITNCSGSYAGWFTLNATMYVLQDKGSPTTFCDGGTIGDSRDDRAYKNFDLSGYLDAYADMLLGVALRSSTDQIHVGWKSAGGDPFAGGGSTSYMAGYFWDFAGFTPALSDCLSSTCTLGFRVVTDASANYAGDGIVVPLLAVYGQTATTNAYAIENGTSMASPHVAGIAALVRSRNPNFTYADTVQAILTGGDTASAFTSYTVTGKTANAFGALKYIPDTTLVSVTSP